MSKKNAELAQKSAADLKAEEAKMRKEIFDLQFKHSTRQLNDTMAIRRAKRDLARVITFANQKRG
jgi:large subunit ribosomal protein L29